MSKRWNSWDEYKAYIKRCMAFTINVYARRIMDGEETFDGFPIVLQELIQERILELMAEDNRKYKEEEEKKKQQQAESEKKKAEEEAAEETH